MVSEDLEYSALVVWATFMMFCIFYDFCDVSIVDHDLLLDILSDISDIVSKRFSSCSIVCFYK